MINLISIVEFSFEGKDHKRRKVKLTWLWSHDFRFLGHVTFPQPGGSSQFNASLNWFIYLILYNCKVSLTNLSLTIGKQLQTEEPVQFILILSKDHCLEECDTVYIIIQTNFLNQCFQYKINLVSMSQGFGKSKIDPWKNIMK